MPIYRMRCAECGAEEDRIVKLTKEGAIAAPLPTHDAPDIRPDRPHTDCGGTMERVNEVELTALMRHQWQP